MLSLLTNEQLIDHLYSLYQKKEAYHRLYSKATKRSMVGAAAIALEGQKTLEAEISETKDQILYRMDPKS